VERSTDAGATWTALPAVTTTTATDTGVAFASTYDYRVIATNGTVSSSPSNVQTVTTPIGLAVPGIGVASPATLSNTTGNAGRTVTVRWTYTNAAQTGFRVYRTNVVTGATVLLTTANSGTGSTCGAAPTSPAMRSCTTVLPQLPASQGTASPYSFTVSALAGATESLQSVPSNEVILNPLTPAAPSNPNVAIGSFTTAGQIRFRWSDNSANETGFRLVRQVRSRPGPGCNGAMTDGPTTTLPQLPAAAGTGGPRTFVDSGLVGSPSNCVRTEYRYQIAALNDGGVSAFSSWSAWLRADNQ
jgi:hypothetical protein